MQTKIITNRISKKSTQEYFNETAEKAEKIIIAVAFFVDEKTILDQFDADKNVTLLVSLRPPTNYHSLMRLTQQSNIELLYLRDDFHSKIFAFYDNSNQIFNGLVGSSNFTYNGLTRNIETNMITRNPDILEKIDKTLFELMARAKSLTPEVLANYEKRFNLFEEYHKADIEKFGQELDTKQEKVDGQITKVNLGRRSEFQEYIQSISHLPAPEFKKSLFKSKYADIAIAIPEDIREASVSKALCFTRYLDEPVPNSIKRVIKRFPTFKDFQDQSVIDFFDTKGIGAKAGKAFLVWYSKLHLGTYEELLKILPVDPIQSLLISEYLKTQFKAIGLSEPIDLKRLDSELENTFPAIAALETRTMGRLEGQDIIASAANLYHWEDLLQCVNRFYQNEIDPKAFQVVEQRYIAVDPDQRTLQNIGVKLGLTRERVRQILENVHDTFIERYIISTDQFYREMISIIMTTQSALEASDVSSSAPDINQADIAMNFIADVFPAVPVLGHLQSPDSKALLGYYSALKKLMDDSTIVDLSTFIDVDLDSTKDILLKLYSIFAAPKYDLAENDNELQIIQSELTLMEAVHACISDFDRPASIEEVADALPQLDLYKGSGKDSFFAQRKRRGIGATALFTTLQRNENLVRIDRYKWGLVQHVAYQDQWDTLAEAAAASIGESEKQYSVASLFDNLHAQFPLLRSRYELDYILKGSNKLKYLGYQTYTSLSAKNTERVTIRSLINDILSKQDKPMSIQDLYEEIGEVRTMDYRGIFTVLSQFPEVINDSNQFVSLKKNHADDPNQH